MAQDRETKPCPKKCGGKAVFNNRTQVPGSGTDFVGEDGAFPDIRYEPAWKCDRCDYYEPVAN
jgi:hypothetical protein